MSNTSGSWSSSSMLIWMPTSSGSSLRGVSGTTSIGSGPVSVVSSGSVAMVSAGVVPTVELLKQLPVAQHSCCDGAGEVPRHPPHAIFVAVTISRPDRWEPLLGPMLRAVTEEFTGGHGGELPAPEAPVTLSPRTGPESEQETGTARRAGWNAPGQSSVPFGPARPSAAVKPVAPPIVQTKEARADPGSSVAGERSPLVGACSSRVGGPCQKPPRCSRMLRRPMSWSKRASCVGAPGGPPGALR